MPLAALREIPALFRSTRNAWAAEADRLDTWVASEEKAVGREDCYYMQVARFQAARLRLGAAFLGRKP